MKEKLKNVLFSWFEDIILELKTDTNKIDLLQIEKISDDEKYELDFVLEVVMEGIIERITDEKFEGNEVELRELLEIIKAFKKRCIERISSEVNENEKFVYLVELSNWIDKLELLLIDRYADEEKIYLNLKTVSRIGESVIMVIKNDNVYYANDIAKSMFNLQSNRGLDLEMNELFHEIKEIRKSKYEDKDSVFEGKIKNLNIEEENWIEFRISRMIFEKLGLKLLLGHDVSERKKFEKKLRESEEKHRMLLEAMPDPLYVYGEEGITFANNAAIKLFGYEDFSEIENRKMNDMWTIEQDSQSKYQQKMDKLKRTGRMNGLDKHCKRKTDGKILELETTAVEYNAGDKKYVINITRDMEEKNKISDLRSGVREKTLKLNEAKKYDELKNEFLANISHEFKTPINIIMTAMKLLGALITKEDLDIESLKRYIFLSEQNCYRLIKLVDNILDITKIDAGAMELNLEKDNVVEFVENVTDSVREYIASKELTLIFDTDKEENEIIMDKTIIERVLLNLLSNSAKYTNAGGTISVGIIDNEEDIVIEVKDDGIGIPKHKQQDIFQRFVQVDKTLTRNKEGSGIGLSLVKELILIHKGEILLESEEGKGSTFSIRIPKDHKELNERYESTRHIAKKTRTLVESIDVQFSDIYAQW